MSIFDTLEKELDESFSYTLHDKLIFISGFLVDDEENEDLLNFVNYLLYTEKPEISLSPQLDLSSIKTGLDNLSTTFNQTEQSYRKCIQSICRTCKYYKEDVLKSPCQKCKYFSQFNSKDCYEKLN